MSEEKWGVGNAADAKAFGTVLVGDEVVGLIQGEHPHSRQDNSLYARFPSGMITGFDGHRPLVDIQIESYNYLKDSYYSGGEVRKGGTARIFFNKKQVYEFFFRDPQRALIQAYELIDKLREQVPFDLYDEDEVIGQKVWYREIEAVVVDVVPKQGCIIVSPDSLMWGNTFPGCPWDREEDLDDKWIDEGELERVKVDVILDPNLRWFRKEPDSDTNPDPSTACIGCDE